MPRGLFDRLKRSFALGNFTLKPRMVPEWPKLAWVATFAEGSRQIDVLHGPMVEVAGDWVVEAVWAGRFECGDFDRTDLVFGSGVRIRGDEVVFVSPATAMDRLWFCQRDTRFHVSNSLGALSACAGLSLIEEHRYVNDRLSDFRTTWGLESCIRAIPARPVDAKLIWFDNLAYDGRRLYSVDKPDLAPRFSAFEEYAGFLIEGARAIRRNLESRARRNEVIPVATVSSGYDSSAAAVVARHAGCTQAVTIKQSTSFWRGSDSGREIAERLGMVSVCCDRTAQEYPHEAAFWAASGWCNLLNWTLFPYSPSVCLLFQGNYGDAVWDRKPLPDPFTIEIWDDLAMDEFRLIVGMLQCPVPFWGMRRASELNRITFSKEMNPWTLHGKYDRPIPRRLVEEAGIPRGTFAVRKKDTSHEAAFRWPYSVDSQASFRKYLRARGSWAPGRLTVALLRRLAHLESLLHNNIFRKLGLRKRFRPWTKLAGTRLLFQWANHELRAKYQAGLRDAGLDTWTVTTGQPTPASCPGQSDASAEGLCATSQDTRPREGLQQS